MMLSEDFVETRAMRHQRVKRGAAAALAALQNGAVSPKTSCGSVTPEKPYVPPYECMWFYDLVMMQPKRQAVDDDHVPTVRTIQVLTCVHFRATRSDLISHRRSAAVCLARHVSYYLAKDMTTLTLTEIGRLSGRRDHSTIAHGANKVGALIQRDAELAARVRDLRDAIEREVMR